jgi:hypothetical protein
VAAIVRKMARLLSWLLPHGVHLALQRWRARTAEPVELVSQADLVANRALSDRHAGESCFVLGNGPSARALDLLALRGQTVISVSNGYLHENYAAIAPRYHCLPQVTYGRMTDADVVTWFTEMHERLGDAELFLNETEAAVVREHNLFAGRKVHYLAMRENFDEMTTRQVIDISIPVPRVQSVPVMAIMIAMYLGFEKIALLGVDHDHFKEGRYVYAFNLGVQEGKDTSVGTGGEVKTSWHDDFQSLARLWRQYRVLGEISRSNGRRIVNATPGGELDEFERVQYRTLFPEATP